MSRIYGIYLVKIWIQNVGDIDFKVISAAENSNKFQKNQVLEGKISRGHGNTWPNGNGHTSLVEFVVPKINQTSKIPTT